MSTLVMFHCRINTGYAIASLERTFFEAACRVEGDSDRIHFSYKRLGEPRSAELPREFDNYFEFDISDCGDSDLQRLRAYVRRHGIRRVLAFDLWVGHAAIGPLRRGGAETLVAYYGAPMSSINSGLKLWFKRLEAKFKSKADHYVFESEAMRRSGVEGRGLPRSMTSVVHLGVDQERYRPAGDSIDPRSVGIAEDRLIVLYTGHVTPRKGIPVLIDAMKHLVDELGDRRLHLLVCGDKEGQARPYEEQLRNSGASDHVTFAGYRDDIPSLMRTADVGVIASTGWDSFTVSAVEMASSGLPMVVSDLQGLSETVEDGRTGFLFPPGDHRALASKLRTLADDPELRKRFGREGRRRAERMFSREGQVESIARILRGEFR